MTPNATHANTPRATPSLGWFVSLSLLLHLGLLWGVHTARPTPLAANTTSPLSLAVRLQPPATPAAKHAAPSPPPAPIAPPPNIKQAAPKAAVAPAPKPQTVARKQEPPQKSIVTTAAVPPLLPASHRASDTSASTDKGDRSAAQKRLRISIQQALAEHFRYPLMARRHGWQGEVLLAFRVGADGRILDARIARSSGYGLLDDAALNALGKVHRIEHGTAHSFTLQLPVIYRLEG